MLRRALPFVVLIGCHLAAPYSSSSAIDSDGGIDNLPRRSTDAQEAGGVACSADGSCPTHCRSWGVFSTPVPIAAINDNGDNWAPEVSIDGLTLVFSTDGDLMMATRASPQVLFGAPSPIPGLPTRGYQDDPVLTGDGLEIFYSQHSNPAEGLKTATRGSLDDGWEPASAVDGLPGSNREGPWISKDGLRIYFTDDSGGNDDIVMAERPTRSGAFGSARPVLAGGEDDAYPTLSADELTIAFRSKRSAGPGRLDVWMAIRSSTSGDFGEPFVVDGVNSPKDDFDPALSPNGDVLYFSSERGRHGDGDIYYARRQCLD